MEYKNHHYVPIWYQKRFIPTNQTDQEFFYLDMKPKCCFDSRGKMHEYKAVRRQGFRHCFAKEDLYTLKLGPVESIEIERYFFGHIDRQGHTAINYFTNFKHPSVSGGSIFNDMLIYMSTQKLRTPKGLEWLSQQVNSQKKYRILEAMLKLRGLYCAIWTECIWQIADASHSSTKFIISDHPVTVYNRICGPHSHWCRNYNDPDIWLNGTHTIFPLSLDKILILTNLSWVRNPYQSEINPRPNPNPFRGAIFKFTNIQTLRYLNEQEVLEINYIIKRRALRFIAAANKEWLYPEKKVSTQWNSYGNGYLFMPDPRPLALGGEIFIGYKDGHSEAFDAYGRRPWQLNYNEEQNKNLEWDTLHCFQGEFARLFGPHRRGRSFNFVKLDPEKDDEKFHKYHLSLEKKNIKRKFKK